MPCTVGQINNNVLDFSILIFQHLVKLQEPSVSFNLAISSSKLAEFLEGHKDSMEQRILATGTISG